MAAPGYIVVVVVVVGWDEMPMMMRICCSFFFAVVPFFTAFTFFSFVCERRTSVSSSTTVYEPAVRQYAWGAFGNH